MSIIYRLDKQTDNLHGQDDKKHGLYPRVIRLRTVKLRELCRRAADGTTFNATEVEASVQLVVNKMIAELGDSNHVCIDGFGTFSVSAKAIRAAASPGDIRGESIRLKRIVFKTSKTLMKHTSFKFRRQP